MSGKVITLDGLGKEDAKVPQKKMGFFGAYAEGALSMVKWAGIILVAGISQQIGIRIAAKFFEKEEDKL